MRKNVVFVCATIGLIAVMVFGANYGQFKTIDYVVGIDAERKAVDWAAFAAHDFPDIDQLLETGQLTSAQTKWISNVAQHGGVFRFKLFDKFGQNILISDGVTHSLRPDASEDHSAVAREVFATGKAHVSLNDGRQKEDRPDLYAEAYVPVRGIFGYQTIGVAEVYLDQTEMQQLFRSAFVKLSVVLSIAFTSALLMLYGAYLFKRKQEGKSRSQVDYLANYDQLSNLYNRGGFDKNLKALQKSGQMVPRKTVIIYLDIDHFKHINDSHGHKSGDAFLRHVGQAISSCLEPTDIASRFGGDEFVVVAQRPNLKSACALVERLQALVSRPLYVDGTTISGSLSLGVHFGIEAGTPIEADLHRADLALYQAKLDGRNTYRVFTPELETKLARRRKVEAAVLTGVARDLFAVHFQPLIKQDSHQCVGFEALLRLTDADGETIHPDEFIPIAESIGAIKKLGAWALARAVEAASNWPDTLTVAVNLSVRQFDDGDLVPMVKQVLKDTGLSPNRLELEVTESLLMENTDSVAEQLAALRALGVSIAMDDFGTGYSSLGYLWKFGFDKLKIDRSFVLGLEENSSRAREILDTIIMLGHRLNMSVTAEGIETQAQANVLSGLACDHVQGFLFGRPMPATELSAFLLTNMAARINVEDEAKPKSAIGK